MKTITWIICLTLSVSLNSQNILTIDDVKVITLENNFGIKIAKNNVAIAKNQTDKVYLRNL